MISAMIMGLTLLGYKKFDKQSNLPISVRSLLIASLLAIVLELPIWLVYDNKPLALLISIVLGHLAFSFYTDYFTKEIYIFPTIITFVFLMICLLFFRDTFSNGHAPATSDIILSIVLIGVMSLTCFIGFGLGDVCLYIELLIVYILGTESPTFYMLVNMLVANMLFLLFSIPRAIKNKTLKLEPRAFAGYILVGSYITFLM